MSDPRSNCTVQEMVEAVTSYHQSTTKPHNSALGYFCQAVEHSDERNYERIEWQCAACVIAYEAWLRRADEPKLTKSQGLGWLTLFGQDAIDACEQLRELADPSVAPLPRIEHDWWTPMQEAAA